MGIWLTGVFNSPCMGVWRWKLVENSHFPFDINTHKRRDNRGVKNSCFLTRDCFAVKSRKEWIRSFLWGLVINCSNRKFCSLRSFLFFWFDYFPRFFRLNRFSRSSGPNWPAGSWTSVCLNKPKKLIFLIVVRKSIWSNWARTTKCDQAPMEREGKKNKWK